MFLKRLLQIRKFDINNKKCYILEMPDFITLYKEATLAKIGSRVTDRGKEIDPLFYDGQGTDPDTVFGLAANDVMDFLRVMQKKDMPGSYKLNIAGTEIVNPNKRKKPNQQDYALRSTRGYQIGARIHRTLSNEEQTHLLFICEDGKVRETPALKPSGEYSNAPAGLFVGSLTDTNNVIFGTLSSLHRSSTEVSAGHAYSTYYHRIEQPEQGHSAMLVEIALANSV
jgi:hypothetical protein